eukprot:2249751-Rhodomonas_salina.1
MNAAQEVDPLIFEADRPSSSPSLTPFQNRGNTPGTPGSTQQKLHVRFTPPGNPVLAIMTQQEAVQFALNATDTRARGSGLSAGQLWRTEWRERGLCHLPGPVLVSQPAAQHDAGVEGVVLEESGVLPLPQTPGRASQR